MKAHLPGHAPRHPARTAAAAALLAGLLGARAGVAAGWEPVAEEAGIQVWRRPLEGSSLVEFRALTSIRAPLARVAAVLRNKGREVEWMKGCVDSRALAWRSATHAFIYHRLASPAFFISDRDLVVEARTTVLAPEATLLIDFESAVHPTAPEVPGVVRMPRVSGRWRLTDRGGQVEVEYRVQADPGGALPHWLVNWASASVPLETLRGLAGQVDKPGYELDQQILEQAIDFAALARTAASPTAPRGPAQAWVQPQPNGP